MPLPTGAHAQETQYLRELYDEYCKIVLNNITRSFDDGQIDMREDTPGFIANCCHQIAHAMIEERKK